MHEAKILLQTLVVILSSSFAFANEATSSASSDEAFSAAVQLMIHYSQKPGDGVPQVKADEIGGCCFFRGTKLTLQNSDNTVVDHQTVSDGAFSFRGIKNGTYTMTANHRSFKADEKLVSLVPGKYLTVKHSPTDNVP